MIKAALLSAVVVTLGAAMLVVAAHFFTMRADLYAVVIDGGSSHSAFFVYQWAARPLGTTSDVFEVPKLRQKKFSCEHTPGISTFAGDPAAAGESLQACLANASAALPEYARTATPAVLRATAGMRVLNLNNASASATVLAATEAAVINAGFNANTSSSAILSGEAEGAFGWTTANYMQDSLKAVMQLAAQATSHQTQAGNSSSNLVGALDLGGASTQITFLPETPVVSPFDLTLFGRTFPLYTTSYLCYGANAAKQRAISTRLVDAAASNANLSIGCLPRGYDELVSSETVAQYRTDFCSSDLGIPPNITGQQMVGASDPGACRNLTTSLISRGKEPRIGVGQPMVGTTPMLAFSAFWHTVDYQCRVRNATGCEATSRGGWRLSPRDLLAASSGVCAEDLATLVTRSPGVKEQYLVWFCFTGMYIHDLLVGYGFPDDSLQVEFVDKIDSHDIGWTLGFMLNHTTSLPEDAASRMLSAPAFDGIVAGGVLLMCTAVAAGLFVARRHQRMHDYDPIQG